MKILIVYFSQTGNTEMVAKAVHDQLHSDHDVQLSKMADIEADKLAGYDLVFAGTPIHAGGIAGDAQKFMAALPESASFAVASLVTHASALYMNEAFDRGIGDLEKICKDKSINYLGCFNCQGKLDPKIQPMVQKMQKLSDEEFKERMDETDKHPSEEDLANARAFADQVVLKI